MHYKSFMIEIYYCKDSGQYYKTTIRANLPFREEIHYGC